MNRVGSKYHFTFSDAVGALIAAAAYPRKTDYRAENPFVDRAWTKAETLLEAFGLPLSKGDSIGFFGVQVPFIVQRLLSATAAIKDHWSGCLCYTFMPGEEEVCQRYDPDIKELRQWLRKTQAAMLRDLLLLAKPQMANKTVVWNEKTARENRWLYEEDLDDNF
jgi:hypothetical protein